MKCDKIMRLKKVQKHWTERCKHYTEVTGASNILGREALYLNMYLLKASLEGGQTKLRSEAITITQLNKSQQQNTGMERRELYQLPVASITNHHKHKNLKAQKCISYTVLRQHKIKVTTDHTSYRGSQESLLPTFSICFLLNWVAVCISWIFLHYSIWLQSLPLQSHHFFFLDSISLHCLSM